MSFLKHLLPAWKTNLEDKTKANAAILASLDTELTAAEQETISSKLMLSLETATGEWLDQYGKTFGLIRQDNESDEAYRIRIIDFVLLRRGTIPAIKDAIRAFLQDYESNIEIYEPYTNVFILNQSKLNGNDHLLGTYYTVAVIDINISRPFPAGIMDIINEFKPAGVKVHLTYRPNAYNPDAPIVEGGVRDVTHFSHFTNMNGMDARIRGHLNLTARSRSESDTSGVFVLNDSKLNSLDRLTGSFSVANDTYNLASYSTEDLLFTNATTVSEVSTQTTPMSSDFYTKTGDITDQYAVQVMDGNVTNYMYFTLDVATFFDKEYSEFLREAEPSGIYTKDTYLSLMDNPAILYQCKAAVAPSTPTHTTIQALNLETNQWEDIAVEDVKYTRIGGKFSFNLEDSLSDSGILFVRVKVDPNPSVASYEFHTHFFELGFTKEMGVSPTIEAGVRDVSHDSITTPVEQSP
jgi:hypothetical protein